MSRCLYCGKEIPEYEEDTLGRKITRKSKFCRGTQCRKKYWDRENIDLRKEYDRKRYHRKKAQEYERQRKLKKKGEINEVDKKT